MQDRYFSRAPLSLFFVIFVVNPIHAQPAPDPETERKSFQVAEGFEVSLFAADPMLAKPIQMNFDPAGRLWVATSEVYPQIKPGQVADDKVLVIEDTTGAGKADKVTVFARGLLIPTGVLPGDGGVYVANSTEIVHFKDTDGDGKADEKRVVLSGFGTEDTHHIIHTFRWGPDGTFYFNQSVYIHSSIETPWGPRRLAAGGTWAYRPESQKLEVFSRGLINHWGQAWDKYGDSFMTDGAGDGGIHYAFPGVCFWSLNDQAPRILQPDTHGLNKGSPKFAGAEIISGRHFPDDWQGDVITNDFRAHRTVRFKLSEDGSGFSSKPMPDLIKSTDQAYRPIDVKMGPDGALYIADWYNPIINHGEVDFRDPRRDKTHGRIWRVTAKGRPLVERPKLAGVKIVDLLEQLRSPEDYTRRQARLALREMNRDAVLAVLNAWTQMLPASDEFTRLQALWTYQTIDVTAPLLLGSLLNAKDPGIRAAATRVIGAWASRLKRSTSGQIRGDRAPAEVLKVSGEKIETLLERLVHDPHPRVRLEAVRALATLDEPLAMELALQVLDQPMDQFLDFALYLTANELEKVWLPEFQSGKLTFGHDAKKIQFALTAIRNPAAIKTLVDDFKAGKIAAESQKGIGELIASLGSPDDLAVVLKVAMAGDGDVETKAALLQALEKAARNRNVKPKGDLATVGWYLGRPVDARLTLGALRLAGAWKVKGLHDEVKAFAMNAEASAAAREAAIDSLRDLDDAVTLKAIAIGTGPRSSRIEAVAAMAQLDVRVAADLAPAVLQGDAGASDPGPLYAAFLKRKDGPAALTAALKSTKIPADSAKLSLRAVYALGSSDPALVAALKAAGGIESQAKQLSADEMKELIADVQSKGDPARGEAIFRRGDTACMKCHSIAGAGGSLAPDLLSIGASAPVDYLIESILLPNKAIKEGYHSLIVETNDGDQITGIRVRQSDKDLILRDAVQDEIVIPLTTIKGKPRQGGSMMPAGLADSLTRQELTDLVRFLSELGRPGPFAVGQQQLARRWQVLEPAPANAKAGEALELTGEVWMPAYSQVSGTLPGTATTRLARAEVNVTTAGAVRFLVSSPVNGIWVDDRAVAAGAEVTVELTRGVHSVTVAAPANAVVRLELGEAAGSGAKVQFVTGR